jgi:TusA-related sulfurtransferase
VTRQGSFDLAAVARGIRLGRHHWELHVLERMAEREIVRADVLAVLQGGEVIEVYPDDTPFPRALILGFVSNGPLHVVVALDASGPDPYIITVYQPSPDKFEPDWKTRRKR